MTQQSFITPHSTTT